MIVAYCTAVPLTGATLDLRIWSVLRKDARRSKGWSEPTANLTEPETNVPVVREKRELCLEHCPPKHRVRARRNIDGNRVQ